MPSNICFLVFFFFFLVALLVVFLGRLLPGNFQCHSHESDVKATSFRGKATSVDLAGPANQSVVDIVAQHPCANVGHRRAGVWLACRLTKRGANELALRRSRQPNARIPVRMLSEPGKRFRTHSFHGNFGHDFVELLLKRANPTVGQHDVRVKNLTRFRVNATRTNRRADIVVQPANEVVLDVFRVLGNMLLRLRVLLPDFDGIDNSDFFKTPCSNTRPLREPIGDSGRGVVCSM